MVNPLHRNYNFIAKFFKKFSGIGFLKDGNSNFVMMNLRFMGEISNIQTGVSYYFP